jgi:hypothetical protein
METLQSIFSQSVPVTTIILLTEKITEKLTFPAKISKVLNNMTEFVRIEKFDYILRVDADVILPNDFIEKNLQSGCKAMGYGYAQLIEVKSFMKCMGGKFNPEHDDGYIIEKFKYCGVPVSWDYVVKPKVKRQMGSHHGSGWYLSQGELKYKYGWEPVNLGIYTLKHFGVYSIFEILGFFNALFRRKKRFDVAGSILNRQLDKFRFYKTRK